MVHLDGDATCPYLQLNVTVLPNNEMKISDLTNDEQTTTAAARATRAVCIYRSVVVEGERQRGRWGKCGRVGRFLITCTASF